MSILNLLQNTTTSSLDLLTNLRLYEDSETTTETTTSMYLDEASRRKAPDIHDQIDEVVARINFGFMFFGIVGNFICICVLMQKNLLNRKFNWYLLLLAVADLAFSVIVFTNYYIVLNNHTYALYDLSWVTCYFTDYVVNSLDAFCVFLTLVLSVDRLYAIMKPIQSKTFFTYRYPKQIAVFGYLALLAIKSPELFLSQRKYVYSASSTASTASSYASDPSSTLSYYLTYSTLSIHDNLSSTTVSSSTLSYMTSTLSADNRDISIRENYCQLDTIGLNEPISQSNDSSSSVGGNTTVAGNATPLIIYILYCNIFIPLLFNIVPALIILALNLTLWCFIRHYTHISNTSNLNHARSLSSASASTAATTPTNPYQIAASQNGHKTTSTSSSRLSNASNSMNGSMASTSSYLASISKSRVTKAQKSYYFTIIMLGIWLLLTTIPYYSLYTYYWATSLRFINDRTRLHMTVQAISSAFFNSNHCINIVIYLLFHKDFRSNALHIMCQVFNINPLCKINPLYFGSHAARTLTERNVYKTRRYQAAEYSCTNLISPPQTQPHIVRICEPTANDIHLISDRPFRKLKQQQQQQQGTPQELKSCLNGSSAAQYLNQTKNSIDMPPLTLNLKRSSSNNPAAEIKTTTTTTVTTATTSYHIRQKRQQSKDYARPERLFIPNRALLKFLGGGNDVDDKRKNSPVIEEPLCDTAKITHKLSTDGSSNLSLHKNNSNSEPPISSSSSSKKTSFWEKFNIFRMFFKKK